MIVKARRPKVRRYTAEKFEAKSDFDRYELVNGIPVEKAMGAESSSVEINIGAILREFVLLHRLGRVYPGTTGFHCFADRPNTVRRPDAAFVAADRLPGGKSPKGFFQLAPDLAVEVVSPRDRAAKLETKICDYLAAGVKLVWVVYPDSQTVHVRTPDGGGRVIPGTGTVDGGDVLPGFTCAVAKFFE